MLACQEVQNIADKGTAGDEPQAPIVDTPQPDAGAGRGSKGKKKGGGRGRGSASAGTDGQPDSGQEESKPGADSRDALLQMIAQAAGE